MLTEGFSAHKHAADHHFMAFFSASRVNHFTYYPREIQRAKNTLQHVEIHSGIGSLKQNVYLKHHHSHALALYTARINAQMRPPRQYSIIIMDVV